ncbi:hypothetical protein QG37_04022 [Candidozyma auris]|uniref:Uncharacterized protein n=1 Tax=Candidozyma auris TaxID=498019 RepID=A0A0L0NXM5_CANAR|nr:hypothetical protein QG37_04022 [[Candida] auris]
MGNRPIWPFLCITPVYLLVDYIHSTAIELALPKELADEYHAHIIKALESISDYFINKDD